MLETLSQNAPILVQVEVALAHGVGKGWARRAAVAVDSYPLKHLGSSAESWHVRTGLAVGRSPSLGFTGGFGG